MAQMDSRPREGLSLPLHAVFPPAHGGLDRWTHDLPPTTETEFHLTRPLPKRCANFGNERLNTVRETETGSRLLAIDLRQISSNGSKSTIRGASDRTG